MIDVRNISISSIEIGQRLRQIDNGQVEAIKASILDIGLLNPIAVYPTGNDRFGLVAGAHRFEAYRRIGYEQIPANVLDISDLERQLAECDENLCGTKLTPSEEAIFIARRKKVYEALHPETKHGASLGSDRVEESATRDRAPRFITDTAEKTGISERSVSKHAERGNKILPEALELIRGSAFDKGVYLDELKRLPLDQQVAKVKSYLAGEAPERRPIAHLSGAVTAPKGGIAGRYASAQPKPATPAPVEVFERFIRLIDEIEAMAIPDIVAGSARKRSVLGQRASGLADRMSAIMEALDQ